MAAGPMSRSSQQYGTQRGAATSSRSVLEAIMPRWIKGELGADGALSWNAGLGLEPEFDSVAEANVDHDTHACSSIGVDAEPAIFELLADQVDPRPATLNTTPSSISTAQISRKTASMA